MRTTNGLHSCFRKSEVLHLPFPNQFLYRSCHIFDRHARVDTVLIEQIDGIDLEPLERGFGYLPDVLRPAVQTNLFSLGAEFESELGGYYHLAAEGRKRFAHKFFVCERSVGFSGVEEGDAAFDSLPNQGDHFLLVRRRTIAKAHSHAP